MGRRTWWAVGGVVLALQTTLFALDLCGGGRLPWGDESMYWLAAGRILERGDSGLDLLWPPLGAWFLAAIRGLGGGTVAVAVVQLGLLAAAAALLRRALAAAGAEPRVADGSAALLLVYPTGGAFAHYLWPEVLHLALFSLALWLLAARRDEPRACAALGGVLGLALLTKSLLAPLVPVVLLILALGGTRRFRRTGLAALTLLAVLAPTLWLNQQRHGRAMIASSARFNLWVGLNDHGTREFETRSALVAFREWRESGATFAAREAVLARRIADLIEERGVARILVEQAKRQYFRLFGLSSFLTEQLPGGAIHARGRGYRDPPRGLAAIAGWSHRLVYPTVLLLAPWGLMIGLRRRQAWAGAALLLLAYALLIFLVLHVKTRYRIQLLPALLPAAAAGAVWWADRLRGRPEASGLTPPGGAELALAGTASVLLALLTLGA
jgi:4-amino-4-deoxy-L-arabinose transferase-like glycosyltransferase